MDAEYEVLGEGLAIVVNETAIGETETPALIRMKTFVRILIMIILAIMLLFLIAELAERYWEGNQTDPYPMPDAMTSHPIN